MDMSEQKQNKWTLLAFLCATFVIYTIDRALLGPLAIPIQKDTGITDVEFGVLNAAVFWTYAAVVPFAGYVGDRFDRGILIGVASIVWSAMTLLAGFASGFWSLFLLVSFAVTAPQTIYSPSALALIAAHHVETRGKAMSIHQAAYYSGWFLSGIAVAAVLAWFGSWRAAYFVFGSLGVFLGIVFLLRSLRVRRSVPAQATAVRKPSPKAAFLAFFGCPSALLAALAYVALTFVAFGYSAWGPKFVALKFKLSPGAAGSGVMFWHFAAAFGAILVAGWLTDIFVRRYPRFRLVLQSLALLGASPMLVLFGMSSALCLVWVAAATFGVMKGLFEANTVNSIFDVVPPEYRASAMGYANVLAGTLAAFAPVILGWLSQHHGVRGLEVGFAAFGAVLVAASLLLCVSIRFTFRRDRQRMNTEG